MKYKRVYLPIILMIVVALALGGCGKKPEEPSAQQPSTQKEEPTQPATPKEEQPQNKSWTSPPAMQIDTSKNYEAEVKTSKGSFTIQLFAKDAPKTVNNFVFLSKEGFYDNVTFHRIIESFMIQTGDPTGTGAGGPGYSFEDEKTSYKYEPGIVAMANAGPNTNGSQFFICTGADSEGLNSQPNYTIFGKVTDGMDVVKKIAATPVEPNPDTGEPSKPTEKVTIDSIKINEK
ncbi:peptidylprolyl isomerase [Paenibacillus sp. KQZ6P-2]|uniref:Peptidyl-prolyl cis-trans isomerase n=1 Tax=Paenibacillus mangrovi TaxID=2931978 RepID=A0A9X1WM15_9BACL|nr:peptidylprolyl isomerase [Paenibacillus mangrovi]MCJ8011782.1 peptidylprolyl isomerase [Paenibacillus mangrovi]